VLTVGDLIGTVIPMQARWYLISPVARFGYGGSKGVPPQGCSHTAACPSVRAAYAGGDEARMK